MFAGPNPTVFSRQPVSAGLSRQLHSGAAPPREARHPDAGRTVHKADRNVAFWWEGRNAAHGGKASEKGTGEISRSVTQQSRKFCAFHRHFLAQINPLRSRSARPARAGCSPPSGTRPRSSRLPEGPPPLLPRRKQWQHSPLLPGTDRSPWRDGRGRERRAGGKAPARGPLLSLTPLFRPRAPALPSRSSPESPRAGPEARPRAVPSRGAPCGAAGKPCGGAAEQWRRGAARPRAEGPAGGAAA